MKNQDSQMSMCASTEHKYASNRRVTKSVITSTKNSINVQVLEWELQFYLLDRQLHNIGEIIRKCEIILSGDSHKGTNWPLS